MIKKILNFTIILIMFFVCISNVKADEITSFEFMGKGNDLFMLGPNDYINGNFAITVEDITQTKPYINLLVATTGYPDFIITENNYFSNTVIKKLYSSGSIKIDGYDADLYLVQFATRGTGWNCSSSGLNCYVNTQLSLSNSYDYNVFFQLQSIALTDSVLTDDYLSKLQINQNNQIIEQGKETNEKLDNLDETIQSGNQAIQDSIEESNKETQEVIKDQFNSCRESYNLLPLEEKFTFTRSKTINVNLPAGTYYLSLTSVSSDDTTFRPTIRFADNNIIRLLSNNMDVTINLTQDETTIYLFTKTDYPTSAGISAELNQLMISKVNTKYEPYGEEICSNKIDDTNDKLDNLQGSINDDSTDGANDKISNFFSDFSTKDHGGLSSIITAPLEAINQMLNKNCSPMSATYKGKKIELPCGYDFWAKMPQIKDFLNMILGGILCYNILKKLYKLIERLKNPEDDRVDVMDL